MPSALRTPMNDLTDKRRPVLATCPTVGELVGGYHHHARFFFADEQVADIAVTHQTGRTPALARGGTGWRLRGDRPTRLLLRVLINGQIHYEFPADWQWRPLAVTRQPRRAGRH